MKPIRHFFTHMDQKAAGAVIVSLGLFAVMIAIVIVGKHFLDFNQNQIGEWLSSAQNRGLALPLTVLVFCTLACVGAPQWALIAASVVAFGPIKGFSYAYVATLVSASLTFYMGRWMGAQRLKHYGGDFVNRFLKLVQRNGFLASLMVRVVPTAPFIIVNMAAGVSGMSIAAFITGTGIGIIPKMAAIAFFSEGVKGALTGYNLPLILGLFALAAIWIAVMLMARKRLRGRVDVTESD